MVDDENQLQEIACPYSSDDGCCLFYVSDIIRQKWTWWLQDVVSVIVHVYDL